MTEPKCGNCRFFAPDPEQPGNGECHRYPARATGAQGERWVTVYPNEWCGEHQPHVALIKGRTE